MNTYMAPAVLFRSRLPVPPLAVLCKRAAWTTAVLAFDRGSATVICATQLPPFQAVSIHGSNGRIELAMPFNPPSDIPTTIRVYHSADPEEVEVAPAAQMFTAPKQQRTREYITGRFG